MLFSHHFNGLLSTVKIEPVVLFFLLNLHAVRQILVLPSQGAELPHAHPSFVLSLLHVVLHPGESELLGAGVFSCSKFIFSIFVLLFVICYL